MRPSSQVTLIPLFTVIVYLDSPVHMSAANDRLYLCTTVVLYGLYFQSLNEMDSSQSSPVNRD